MTRLLLMAATMLVAANATASPALEEAIRSCDAAAAVAELARINDGSPAERAYDEGRVELLRGRTAEAIDRLETAAELAPGVSSHRLWLSRALFARANEVSALRKPFIARRAIRELKRALELDAGNDDASVDLLLIHLRVPILGDGRDAADEIAASLRRRRSPVAPLTTGILAYEDEDWARAERELTRAAETLDDPRRALFWIGYLYQRQHRWDEAFEIHEKLLGLSPNDPRVWYEIARTSDFSGRRTELGITMLRRYLQATLPSGATSRDDARELLTRLRNRPERSADVSRWVELEARCLP